MPSRRVSKSSALPWRDDLSQALFGYDWDELTRLPSRLSAEAPERSERQAFLEQVARDGFVADYRGIRVAKSGARFWIERATVWQLVDSAGRFRGQAAMIPEVKPITPELPSLKTLPR